MARSLTRTQSTLMLALFAAALSMPAVAEKPDATGVVAVASEPGKAVGARVEKLSAEIIGIDKATRTVTLKGPKGKVVDIVAGDEVKNFDQMKVGDMVVARYAEALTLELKKPGTGKEGVTVREQATKAKPGDKPAVASGRQVTVLAEVVAVDQHASTIKIKGPKGKVVTLNVRNPDQFKVVKLGDKIEVTYTEALALSVEPAAKTTKE